MFGIKKLQKELEQMSSVVLQLKALVFSMEHVLKIDHKTIMQLLSEQKLELSKINTKFHDLGEKIAKLDKNKTDCSTFSTTMTRILEEMQYRKETASNLNVMLSEVGGKLDKIYEVTDGYEKLTDNMQHILDEYLPIKKIPKLPKKIKATT